MAKPYKYRENPIKNEVVLDDQESKEPESTIFKNVILESSEEIVLVFDFYLVVKNPFNGYQRGDMILKDEDIQKVIDTKNLPNCLKVKRK